MLLLSSQNMMNGVCTLSNIPLRKEASSKSEIVSMLLFGECYVIISEEGDWTLIKTENDHYEGWISSKQSAILITKPKFFKPVTGYPFAILQSEQGILMAPAGSQLPDFDGMSCYINQKPYTVTQQQHSYSAADIIYLSKQFLNAPYLWGGKTAFGIDCSGFVQNVFKCIGVQLKRDAYQQAEMGTPVAFLEEVQPGDLAFFDNEEGRITHVGIMIDTHSIIHASGKVRIDPIDSYGILNTDIKNYSHKLRIIKRIL